MTKVRIIGLPFEVDHVVAQLSRFLPVRFVSETKPCRHATDRGRVRVYVRIGGAK